MGSGIFGLLKSQHIRNSLLMLMHACLCVCVSIYIYIYVYKWNSANPELKRAQPFRNLETMRA